MRHNYISITVAEQAKWWRILGRRNNSSPRHRRHHQLKPVTKPKEPSVLQWWHKTAFGTQPHSCHRPRPPRSSRQWNHRRWRARNKQHSESRITLPCAPATRPPSEAQWLTSGRCPWKRGGEREGKEETIHFQLRSLQNPHGGSSGSCVLKAEQQFSRWRGGSQRRG